MNNKSQSKYVFEEYKILIFLNCLILSVSLLAGCGINAINERSDKSYLFDSISDKLIENESAVETTERIDEKEPAIENNEKQSSAPSGILVLKAEKSYSDLSYQVNLYLINPETGEAQEWNKFQDVDGAYPTTLFDYRSSAIFTQRQFSPNYDCIAVTKTNSDGSIYAGWITKDGEFINVTSLINSDQADFSDPPRNNYPQFDANGMFYYLDMNKGVVAKVDPESLSSDSVEIVAELKDSEDCFYLYPDGTVQCYFSLDVGSYSTFMNIESGVSTECVQDVLDDSTLLYMEYLYGAKNLKQIYTCTNEEASLKTALLPETATMLVWDPISSADSQNVAFLSMSRSSAESPHLFTVSRESANPVRVQTNFVFEAPLFDSAPYLQLLDWF